MTNEVIFDTEYESLETITTVGIEAITRGPVADIETMFRLAFRGEVPVEHVITQIDFQSPQNVSLDETGLPYFQHTTNGVGELMRGKSDSIMNFFGEEEGSEALSRIKAKGDAIIADLRRKGIHEGSHNSVLVTWLRNLGDTDIKHLEFPPLVAEYIESFHLLYDAIENRFDPQRIIGFCEVRLGDIYEDENLGDYKVQEKILLYESAIARAQERIDGRADRHYKEARAKAEARIEEIELDVEARRIAEKSIPKIKKRLRAQKGEQ